MLRLGAYTGCREILLIPFLAHELEWLHFAAQPLIQAQSPRVSWCSYQTAVLPNSNLVPNFPLIRTHINSCIGLNVFHVVLRESQVPGWALSRADNARCDRVLQCEGTSHGNNKLPLPDISRAAEGQCGKRLLKGNEYTKLVILRREQVNSCHQIWPTPSPPWFEFST